MRFLIFSLMMTITSQLGAQNMIDQSDWTYLADTVMGGVSTGSARVENLDHVKIIHLKGSVSTANNGGFIQVRANVGKDAAKDLEGVRLLVKGNDDTYYIHLRVAGSFVPWHYYWQEFYVPKQWIEIKLPFSKFERSSRMLRWALDPSQIITVGVVAYGKNYEAEILISEVEFY